MRWSDAQIAMLREMGISQWAPAEEDGLPVALADGHVAVEERIVVETPVALAAAPGVSPMRVVPPRAASPVDTLGWPALRDTVAACTACKLCEGRRQTVFGVGNEHAHWMIVGEAPGEQEDLQGEPFVGKSGQLLDNMLRAISLTRGEAEPARQVYIANTIKCRPPNNRNPEPDELAKCEAYLIRQVQLVQPKIILAMGRFAVQSLLRSQEPVGRLRGRVHHYEGVPLIVTYHPAYLLRNPEDKAKAWDDLCLAAEVARGDAAG
jgi:DNA polymerase